MIIKEIYFFLHCHPMINILWIVEWKFREKEMIFFYILDVVQGCNKQCNICYCPDLWQSDNWSHCADDWNLCPSLCLEWASVHCRYLQISLYIDSNINWLNRYLILYLLSTSGWGSDCYRVLGDCLHHLRVRRPAGVHRHPAQTQAEEGDRKASLTLAGRGASILAV